jgi:hypothetical protein
MVSVSIKANNEEALVSVDGTVNMTPEQAAEVATTTLNAAIQAQLIHKFIRWAVNEPRLQMTEAEAREAYMGMMLVGIPTEPLEAETPPVETPPAEPTPEAETVEIPANDGTYVQNVVEAAPSTEG